jgi:hypothetical protein
VAVFPRMRTRGPLTSRLPHARGGVSLEAYAEVYVQLGLPHLREGVSWVASWDGAFGTVFPTLVGVFLQPQPDLRMSSTVFPTHVGVFLHRSCLRARNFMFSPRTWGCFLLLMPIGGTR